MNMKRIATLFAVVGIALIALAPVAGASKPGDDDSLPNGTQLKTDICHWANGHPHIVPVSISATAQPQEVQHGTLTLTDSDGFGSFVAHDTNGHEGDFVVRIYTKHGNDETNTYVSEKACEEEETTTTTEPPTTTTTQPEVTTTTVPEVTTTTQPEVTTTTVTAPVVTNNPAPPATDTPAPVAEVPVVAPVSNTPAEPLAETGANSLMIAMLGSGLASIGIALKMFGKSISSN